MRLGKLKKYTLRYTIISYAKRRFQKNVRRIENKITGSKPEFKCSIKEHGFKFTLRFV